MRSAIRYSMCGLERTLGGSPAARLRAVLALAAWQISARKGTARGSAGGRRCGVRRWHTWTKYEYRHLARRPGAGGRGTAVTDPPTRADRLTAVDSAAPALATRCTLAYQSSDTARGATDILYG